MSKATNNLPNPSPAAVALWLKQLDRTQLHDEAWQDVNRHFHGITRAARSFIQQHYAFEEQEAAYDGLTLGLKTLMRFTDVEQLLALLEQAPTSQAAAETPSAPVTIAPTSR